MHRSTPACLTVALAILSSVLPAQQPPPTCPAAEVHRFDFLVGRWHGREYLMKNPTDSALEDSLTAENKRLPFACAFEEHARSTTLDGHVTEGVILRAYDLPSRAWRYSLADGFVELAIFDGLRTDTGWVFLHELTTTTPHRLLRFQWVPTRTGYLQIIQVSSDSGRTWPIVRHLHYTPDRSR